MSHEHQDHYFREAKREGYVSRAAYKLLEIDDRRKLIRHGQRVLDCGCAPGSWLQILSKRVGRRGIVVGVDLSTVKPQTTQPDNVRFVQGDLLEIEPADLLELAEAGNRKFDLVVSDMAPSTTGDQTVDHHASIRLCQFVLDQLPALLERGGHVIMKVFEGEMYPQLMAAIRTDFKRVKGFKPKASRAISREMFIIAQDYEPGRRPAHDQSTDDEVIPLPPKRKPPSDGWGR